MNAPEQKRQCPAVVGPVWKCGGESWACVLDEGHEGDHEGGDGTWWAESELEEKR